MCSRRSRRSTCRHGKKARSRPKPAAGPGLCCGLCQAMVFGGASSCTVSAVLRQPAWDDVGVPRRWPHRWSRARGRRRPARRWDRPGSRAGSGRRSRRRCPRGAATRVTATAWNRLRPGPKTGLSLTKNQDPMSQTRELDHGEERGRELRATSPQGSVIAASHPTMSEIATASPPANSRNPRAPTRRRCRNHAPDRTDDGRGSPSS